MAVNNLENYNSASDGMAFPLSITRGNPHPIDDSYLYSTLAEAQIYATTSPTAYVGQSICVLNTDIEDGTPTIYVIMDTDGNLKAIGGESNIATETDIDNIYTDLFNDLEW